MNYLLLSICASVAVSVLLKISKQRGLAIAQAVAVNYLVCIALTWLIFHPVFASNQNYSQQWWLFVALGLLLPAVFIVMANAVNAVGIVKADAAQRLSLFISIIAAFVLFHDPLNAVKLSGIILALAALVLLIWKQDSTTRRGSAGWVLAVWLGYGVIDILFKQMAKTGLTFTSYLLITFILAAVVMAVYLLITRPHFSALSLASGVILGGLNFTNIYTYVRAHQVLSNQTALVFTTMNIGVITLATLIGAWIFKEPLSKTNRAGIALAILSIAVLFYGSHWFARQ